MAIVSYTKKRNSVQRLEPKESRALLEEWARERRGRDDRPLHYFSEV
jgi:hypothetical protein